MVGKFNCSWMNLTKKTMVCDPVKAFEKSMMMTSVCFQLSRASARLWMVRISWDLQLCFENHVALCRESDVVF